MGRSNIELQLQKQKDPYATEEEQNGLPAQQYSDTYVHLLPLIAVFVLCISLSFTVMALASAHQGWSYATFYDGPSHHGGHHGHKHHSRRQEVDFMPLSPEEGPAIFPPFPLLPPIEESNPTPDPEVGEEEEEFEFNWSFWGEDPLEVPEETAAGEGEAGTTGEGESTEPHCGSPEPETQQEIIIIVAQAPPPRPPRKGHKCALGWKQGHCHTPRGRKNLYYHKDLKFAGIAALSSQLSGAIIVAAALVMAVTRVYPCGHSCKLTRLGSLFALMACAVMVSGFLTYGHFMKKYNNHRDAYTVDHRSFPTGLDGARLHPGFNFYLCVANAFLCFFAFVMLVLSSKLPLVLTVLRKNKTHEGQDYIPLATLAN